MATVAKFRIVQVGQSDELVRLRKAARELPAEELPNLIGELEAIKAVAWARLTSPAPIQQRHDGLLNVAEAAERLGISEDYLYRHNRQLPFTRRQGRKLLFSALGIDKHILRQRS
jgi:excisionase family DNA binding protein